MATTGTGISAPPPIDLSAIEQTMQTGLSQNLELLNLQMEHNSSLVVTGALSGIWKSATDAQKGIGRNF